MDSPIKTAYQSVKECKSDVLYLKMIYPNNRFALKLYARYLLEIKSDVVQYRKTLDSIALLQRGLKINNDTVHDLGMESFPLIPERLSDSELNIKTGENESGVLDEIEVEEIKDEDYESIVKLIDVHKVPAIQYLYTTTIIAFIFLLLIPIIGICVSFGYFKQSLTDPITYMEGVAYTRNIVNVISCFAVRCLFEELKDPNNPTQNIIGPLTMVPGFPAEAFGGEYVGRKIIEFYAKNIGTMNSMISGLRSFKPGNKHIEKVRDLLFARNIIYHFFITKENVRNIPSSAVDISYQLASTVGRLLDHDVLNVDVAKSSDSLTVRNNNVLITEAASKALTSIVQYIGDNHEKYNKIFWGLFAFFSGMNFIFIVLIFTFQKKKLEKNKNAIITAISELPKTVISNVSAAFSNLKGNQSTSQKASNGHESETNRQEESIIKLFSSISDGVNSSSSYFVLFCYVMIIALSILCFWFAVQCFFSASDVVFYNCHHINYFYGSITFLFALASRLYDICLATYHTNFKDTILDVNQSINEMESYIPLKLTYFHSIRLGGRGKREVPFEGMAEALDRATSIIKCDDPIKPPVEVPESTRCFSASNTLYIAVCYFKRFVKLMKQGVFPLPWGYHVNDVFQVGPLELHEAFFSKTGGELVPYMIKSIRKQETNLIRNSILFVLGAFIFLICILFTINKENTLIKFTIDQLLRVPPSEILRNQHIMRLLTGDYSEEAEEDFSGKYIQFANEVINRLNDIFIVCQEETGKVVQVNASFTNMFGITNEEMENTNIKDFFIESRFQSDGKLDRVYTRTMNAVYTNANNEKFFIEFSSTNVNGRRIFTGKDQTQNVMHEKLIQDEKDKSNKMLASILPASLVSRVQAGEKDISFSVQSSSVLFLDIVEFTPWCGSHDAHYVMRMLNILFKEFDAICNAHKTMTKIKCIGDCYMAAGGIFDEVNQPAVHAKEVVDFGCVVIKKLEEVNMSENEKLRIRVGVNTGGPIVAGVIGTEKPTFEILGPTINIAHEMEHHGVPMKVHISRPVYELIYGQTFDIKERGEIDVKGGKMFTYLVDP
ncbi:Adenylate and Guanylate cyclase catalytic domain containing protein [Trichomonas vaginalis G3]|uniref:Adenylate and Guanylate cyclase catalytic domain containing protein n=1 Tax=Trichomonas vaginalis (strain ATCC PRA-98 / G3) TaxID=412133 RepID=A2DR64_TRIV3|nr:guanylate cyclase protein [Trichomonas vaginalis G3]EAY17163.1 Adenylate and Guanylate cyclase catalytic domain containing protein [Trichomonas vaginalis G3]KAI5508893.1 guanylate cyclase protein [Trichomonas vaginalis G3]|eukprot:XP_001329386.1 Adenylate and Guanylate cyclase catalytic domain containing protein [Trichomonas vaginalis G3]